MNKAFKHAIWLASINLVLGIIAGVLLVCDWARSDARNKIDHLKNVEVSKFAEDLSQYPNRGAFAWRFIAPVARAELAKEQKKNDGQWSLTETRLRLSLLRLNEEHFEPLTQRVLQAEPSELRMICEVLRKEQRPGSKVSATPPIESYAKEAADKFWQVLGQTNLNDETRFRAACAVAIVQSQAAKDRRWGPYLDLIVKELLLELSEDSGPLNDLAVNLHAIGPLLIPKLKPIADRVDTRDSSPQMAKQVIKKLQNVEVVDGLRKPH